MERGGEGEGGERGTYDGLGEVLPVDERVDGVQVRARAAMKRHLVHNLPVCAHARARS